MEEENAYEAARARQIATNRARMLELGVIQASESIAAEVRAKRRVSAPRRRRNHAALADAPRLPARRSGRNEGRAAPVYSDDVLSVADGGHRSRRRSGGAINIPAGALVEVYTQEHLAMLGDCETPWVLFVDGYEVDGSRIYDKAHGLTCHQCRQKTVGKRTTCSSCNSLNGVFCGDCLYMRYGENVDEALANPDWKCPYCRDPRLCNCSIHRNRHGWAPTGSLYRKAEALGYKSAAHYLVLNNMADTAAEGSAAEAGGAAEVPTQAPAVAAAAGGTDGEVPASPASAGTRKRRLTVSVSEPRFSMVQPRIDSLMAASKPTSNRRGAKADESPTNCSAKLSERMAAAGGKRAKTAATAAAAGGKRALTTAAAAPARRSTRGGTKA